MPDERIADLIGYAADKKPGEFQQTFTDIVTDRLVQAVDARRQEIAKNIFNDTPKEPEETPDEDVVDDDPEDEELDDAEDA